MFAGGIRNFLRLLGTGLGLTALAMVGVLGTADLKGVIGNLGPQLSPPSVSLSHKTSHQVASTGRVRCEIRPNWKVQPSMDLELMCQDRPRVP